VAGVCVSTAGSITMAAITLVPERISRLRVVREMTWPTFYIGLPMATHWPMVQFRPVAPALKQRLKDARALRILEGGF
jgi:hypothetical protein